MKAGDSGLAASIWLIFTLTTSLALFLSAASSIRGTTVASATVESAPITEAAPVAVLAAASETPISTTSLTTDQPNAAVEQYVKTYFAKTPILAKVAKCESQYRQFKSDGTVLRGMAVPDDVGVMQINEYFHQSTAKKLGYDIYTLEGNLAYAKYLYEKQGTQPWSASQPCWDK